MENVELEISDDDILRITVDLKKTLGPTTSRKSMRIGSTLGNVQLWKNGKPLGIMLNLTCFRPMSDEDARAVEDADRCRRYSAQTYV